MYNNRIKIFVIVGVFFLTVCLSRLVQLQLLDGSAYREKIAELKLQQSRRRQLKTIRGKILDRNGLVLADDQPRFNLCINYQLTRFADKRVRTAKLLTAAAKSDPDTEIAKTKQQIETRLGDLDRITSKCVYFVPEPNDIANRIKKINDKIWALRTFLTWRRDNKTISDWKKKYPDPNDRLVLINRTNIKEMHQSLPLLELKTDNDVFAAQLEFLGIDDIEILPEAKRIYPYQTVAAQTIGWVGPEQEKKLFTKDRLSSYLQGEVSGRRPGAEYVCEAVLRGRRGEVVYDIDHQLQSRTETQFGKDVTLTLDIELEKKIKNYLTNCKLNHNCTAPMAAVVIEVATGDILALVSTPAFDLNRLRYDYGTIAADPNQPMRNRAINKQYPPGSVIKPMILIAGLESGKITEDEIISCPAQKPPRGWPRCWLQRKYPWRFHDDDWTDAGGNIARNAVKGSCNIYFSRLADRIESSVLHQWLWAFGYGRNILLPPSATDKTEHTRNFRQLPGQITTVNSRGRTSNFIDAGEKRYFGMGQGNLRATPLQVANAMAAIARGGLYKPPRLFVADTDDARFASVALNISPQTLAVVYAGMSAVVNEPGGTGYSAFAAANFSEAGIDVYGKTGSTEGSENAWFAGFAEDNSGRSIAIAVVVEGGQRGSEDAAPLACQIIRLCTEAEYIGQD